MFIFRAVFYSENTDIKFRRKFRTYMLKKKQGVTCLCEKMTVHGAVEMSLNRGHEKFKRSAAVVSLNN